MTSTTAETVRQISGYLQDWVTFHAAYRGTPGAQVAVRVGDEVILDTAWGKANVESGEQLSTEHLFRIASHSKTMTATAVMQLVEGNRIRLDDTLQTHLPDLAGSAVGTLTVREVLGHQGGVIRDSSEADFWQRGSAFLDREQILQVARCEGDTYPSNTAFKYSNIGYSLLGLVIESASGTSYNDYCRTHIVDRLGLTRSGPELEPDRLGEYAAGHTGLTAAGDTRRVVPHVDTQAMAAATGWFSTAREMTAYGAAHFFGDETLITDASKRLLQREETRVRAHGKEIGRYGLGFDLRTVGDRELVGHSGGYPGHITRTWIDPKEKIVVSALTNAIDGPADVLATGVIQLINIAIEAAQSPAPPVEEATRFTGRFANLWGVTDIALLGGKLFSINPRLPEPADAHQRLEVHEGEATIEAVPGFGPNGQRLAIERDTSGRPARVQFGGMSAWPIEEYRAALSDDNPVHRLGRMAL